MLPLIVFFLALYLSIALAIRGLNQQNRHGEGTVLFVATILVSVLWTWFYYLTH